MEAKNPEITIANTTFLPKGVLEKMLPIMYKGSILKIIAKEEIEINTRKNWASHCSLNFYIDNNFIDAYNEGLLEEDMECLFDVFNEPFRVFAQTRQELSIGQNEYEFPFAMFSVFYTSGDFKIFQFLFSVNGGHDDYLKAFIELLKTINEYNSPDSGLASKISKIHTQSDDDKVFFVWDNTISQWQLVNPLLELGKQIQRGFKSAIESREQKPISLIQENDFRNKISALPRNWRIKSDEFPFVMDMPNDVALYSSLADKHLALARAFLIQRISELKRDRNDHFISGKEETSEYFNYFENVIGAVIFSYTAIEAFANICIPWDYTTESKRKNKKEADTKIEIERWWALSDKLKKVLYEVFGTTDPTKNDWWSDFIALEELRNEIIHTKQSKSESRYTKLFSQSIFEIIPVNRKIIKFYGDFMALNKPEMLQEYPYGFGHDEIYPSTTSEKNYNSSYDVLHNPSKK
jgi:hypothetical protein